MVRGSNLRATNQSTQPSSAFTPALARQAPAIFRQTCDPSEAGFSWHGIRGFPFEDMVVDDFKLPSQLGVVVTVMFVNKVPPTFKQGSIRKRPGSPTVPKGWEAVEAEIALSVIAKYPLKATNYGKHLEALRWEPKAKGYLDQAVEVLKGVVVEAKPPPMNRRRIKYRNSEEPTLFESDFQSNGKTHVLVSLVRDLIGEEQGVKWGEEPQTAHPNHFRAFFSSVSSTGRVDQQPPSAAEQLAL